MSNIGNNIKKLRSVKKLNQTAFADIFGLSRTSVGAYEEGRAETKIDTVIQIAKHFGVSTDTLLTKELTVNEIHHFNIFDDKIIGKNKSNETALPLNDINSIKLVSKQNQQAYISEYNSQDFLNTLENISLPQLHQDYHRAFEKPNTTTILFGKKIPLSILKENKTIIIHSKEEITFGTLKTASKTTLALDTEKGESIINKVKITQVWEVISQYTIVTKTTKLEELEKRIEKLERRI